MGVMATKARVHRVAADFLSITTLRCFLSMSTPSCIRTWAQYARCTNLAGTLLTFANCNRVTDE